MPERAPHSRITVKADFVFDWKFALAITALTLLMWELHEQAHIWAGFAKCGSFGARDFNVWSLSCSDAGYMPTIIGPVFSILMGYLGAAMLFSLRASWRAFGIAVIWTSGAIGRLLNVLVFGGGDETFALQNITGLSGMENGRDMAESIATLILFLAVWPLIAILWYKLARRSWLWVPIIAIVPFATVIAVLLGIYNPLQNTGILSGDGLFGGPMIVTLVTGLILIVTALTSKWLFRTPEKET